MKLYPVLIICLVMILNYSTSYSQIRLSIQPGLEVPIGDFSKTASLGFGGSATIEFLQSKEKSINWSFTGMIGYHYFPTNKDLAEGEDYTYSDIPIQAGLRYYTGKSDFKPYLGAELGFHLLTISYQGSEISDTYFGYAPILGIKLLYSRTVDVDINVKYNSISSEGSSLSYLGFNFGVQLALSK